MKRIVPLLAGLLLLVGLLATPALASDVPPLPHAFYGEVEINDGPAPVGTQVEASGPGVLTPREGNPIVTTERGKYGGPGGLDPKLVVQGDIPDGATITFHVNGVVAEQTWEWHTGDVTELDLTVFMPTLPPTVTTDPATGVTRTAAALNGTLTDLGSASSVAVSFEWGTSTSYGSETGAQTRTSIDSFSAALSGLSASTTYHFRAKAVAGEDTSYGIDKSFTTKAAGGGGGGGGGGADTTAPKISDITLCDITETIADICWVTNEKSTSQVEYWTSPSKLSPLDETRVINHLVHLTDLTPGTTYHYKAMSEDAAGNPAISDENTFTTLGEAPAAAFSASDLSISPAEVNIGEAVTISVSVNNTGTASGTYKVTLKIDGSVEDTKEVTLNAGASTEVTFTMTKDVAETYSVEVDGLSGSFTVREKPAEEQEPIIPIKPTPSPWPLIGGIIAAVIVVGLLIFFLVRRRAT